MAQWKVTFRDRRTGRKSEMVIEDVSSNGAKDTAEFFRASRGDVIEAKPVKA